MYFDWWHLLIVEAEQNVTKSMEVMGDVNLT